MDPLPPAWPPPGRGAGPSCQVGHRLFASVPTTSLLFIKFDFILFYFFLNFILFYFIMDLPGPGIEPTSPALAGRFFIIEPPGKSD